jgi:hypothetical protein
MENIIFLTKDAMCRDYLPVYGNEYWRGKTPNIDELSQKGTVFTKYYTGAPSTIMSNICMFTGQYAHESILSQFVMSNIHHKGETLWTKAESLGYECHIIWDESWKTVFKVEERYYCYGENTKIHNLKDIRQGVGAHYIHKESLVNDDKKTEEALNKIRNEIIQICHNAKKPVFLWLHIPHVINGRTGYGADIDVFDEVVGIAREQFDDRNIFISSDHGNMNGLKGKIGYGHDVYEMAIRIPLISPRINGQDVCNELMSNIDISTLIFDRKITKHEVVYSDSTFYAQPNRKLAIISDNYKYIYNKHTKTEELYDLRTDPFENCNIIQDTIYDVDRRVETPLKELYFYPYWDDLEDVRDYFKKKKMEIWKVGSYKEEFYPSLKYKVLVHGGHRYLKWKSQLKK